MTTRLILTVLLLLLFAAFVSVNWGAFIAPTTLSLLVTTIEAPIGLVMLGLLAAVSAIFLGTMAWWQSRVLLETRRHTQELQAQRSLADQAEASRFTALQAAMQTEFAALGDRLAAGQSDLSARLEGTAAELRTELRQTGNGLAAHIGELEDRLEPRSAIATQKPVEL